MRGNTAASSLLASAIVFGLSCAAGCAPRSDAEPDFQPARRALSESAEGSLPASEAQPAGEAQPAQHAHGEGDPAESARANADEEPVPGANAAAAQPPEQSERAATAAQPEPDEVAIDAQPETSGPSCEHPFVATRPGQWRRYVWRQTGEQQAAELYIEALRVRDVDRGEREVTWRIELSPADGGAPLAREELTTRCAPGQSAEEPWFGILERSLGLVPTREARWRWPARLREGDRFSGTASFDASEAEMRVPEGVSGPLVVHVTRSHVVGAREPVEVPAGRWRAWRVGYEEEQTFAERGERGTGTVWVAPEIGMVRSTAENSRGIVQTIELVAHGAR